MKALTDYDVEDFINKLTANKGYTDQEIEELKMSLQNLVTSIGFACQHQSLDTLSDVFKKL